MENVRIYRYKNSYKYNEIEELQTFRDRLVYYFIDNFDFLFEIVVFSQIFNITYSIFVIDFTGFNIFNILGFYILDSIALYIAFFIIFSCVEFVAQSNLRSSYTFKFYHVFKIGLKKYIKKMRDKEFEQEQSFYERRYDLLFFKKENDEIKVKHLIDFIDNNEFTLKGNKLIINDDYHLVNDDNIKKYISSHQDEIDIFKQSINQYYLDGLKIQPYIEKAQFLVDYNGHDEELALKNRLDHFKQNLNIKKES